MVRKHNLCAHDVRAHLRARDTCDNDKLYRLINNISAMHRGCTFLIRKVQDTSAQLPDVRPSTQVA